MPRTVTVLRVFVASPDDVREEREALEEVVREINLTLPERDEIRLDLVRWETHAYPGVGSDTHAVINEQIGDDYDIFVGIMWKHFGTPTVRAGSGTEEEFQRAYQRYRENPDQIRIMFYFNDAPVTPSAIVTDQLASVNEFRDQLGDQGTLYWSYTTLEQFTSFLRIHLNYQVAEWRQTWGTAARSEQATMEVDIPSAADSEAHAVPRTGATAVPLYSDLRTELVVQLLSVFGRNAGTVRNPVVPCPVEAPPARVKRPPYPGLHFAIVSPKPFSRVVANPRSLQLRDQYGVRILMPRHVGKPVASVCSSDARRYLIAWE